MRAKQILTALAIYQIALSGTEFAVAAQARSWREQPMILQKGRPKKASAILERMRKEGTVIGAKDHPVLLGAYRVMVTGAA
jgi:hypothetical protein